MNSPFATSPRRALVAFALSLAFGPALAQTPPDAAPPRPAPATPAAPAALVPVSIGFVELEGDPRYEPLRVYERLVLKLRDHPFAGAQIGIEDAQPLKRITGADFTLDRVTVKTTADMAPAVLKAMDRGVAWFLVDAPAEAFRALAEAVKGRDVLLFNVSAPEDWLRRDLCSREIVHTMPSRAQLMDGLTQFLVFKKWRDFLVLEGPSAEDAETTAAFLRSAKKFGARIVAQQKFTPGSDPRQREKNNPALLSAINKDWDVTFVADSAFDFAREISYRTVKPRPLVGAIDLEPVAWHWTWEHNGAPQVNSRFARYAPARKMEGPDWAAWIAVRLVIQSAMRTRALDFKKQRDFILGPGTFDGDKGLAMSVRPWDHQLRQAVLLASPYSVIASAPMDGFLHRLDVLDTLGDDEPETPCKLNR